MAVKTTLEQLEEVQTAITAVMVGQAYSIAGRSLSRANLSDLESREEKLLARYKQEQGSGGLTVNIAIPRREY